MHIRDWPSTERPREKLLARGPGALSDAELLALFLGSGTAGRDAVASARDLLADRIPEVRVQVRQRAIHAEILSGDYQHDRAFRARFQQWMNGLWVEKDADIARLLGGDGKTADQRKEMAPVV